RNGFGLARRRTRIRLVAVFRFLQKQSGAASSRDQMKWLALLELPDKFRPEITVERRKSSSGSVLKTRISPEGCDGVVGRSDKLDHRIELVHDLDPPHAEQQRQRPAADVVCTHPDRELL